MANQITATSGDSKPLINVFIGQLNGVPAHVCDGRELHTYLENGELFASWIKARIEKYGFVENQDFVIALENSKAKRGGHNRKDYHLTLDMAKELSMVENNDKGREARRYFIDMEKKAIAASGQVVPPSHTETITPSEQQTLSEIVHRRADPYGANRGKALAEIWSRLHNKFRVAKYSQLPRTQLAEAIEYASQMEIRTRLERVEPVPFNAPISVELQKVVHSSIGQIAVALPSTGQAAGRLHQSLCNVFGVTDVADLKLGQIEPVLRHLSGINEKAQRFASRLRDMEASFIHQFVCQMPGDVVLAIPAELL